MTSFTPQDIEDFREYFINGDGNMKHSDWMS